VFAILDKQSWKTFLVLTIIRFYLKKTSKRSKIPPLTLYQIHNNKKEKINNKYLWIKFPTNNNKYTKTFYQEHGKLIVKYFLYNWIKFWKTFLFSWAKEWKITTASSKIKMDLLKFGINTNTCESNFLICKISKALSLNGST
jgi:hypothetical protein